MVVSSREDILFNKFKERLMGYLRIEKCYRAYLR